MKIQKIELPTKLATAIRSLAIRRTAWILTPEFLSTQTLETLLVQAYLQGIQDGADAMGPKDEV